MIINCLDEWGWGGGERGERGERGENGEMKRII